MKKIICLIMICLLISGCGNNNNVDQFNYDLTENSYAKGNSVDNFVILNAKIEKFENYNIINILTQNNNNFDVQKNKISVIIYDSNDNIIDIYKPYDYLNNESIVKSMEGVGLIVYLKDDVDVSKIHRVSLMIEKTTEEK